MKDLSNIEKQLEIFCAFIIDFSKIKATVTKMMASDNENEKLRVNKIFDIISNFIIGTSSADDLIDKLNIATPDKRINHLVQYVKTKLNTNKNETYKVIVTQYKNLNTIIHPKPPQEKIVIDEIDNEAIITADPSVPISTQDLNFLNKIAKLSISNTAEINEANKDFKSLNFKNKLDELYTAKAYYFEQVFANTDIKVQRKLLDIINERQHMRKATQEEKEALLSLQDINTLSDIDTLALKTSSNVSDHQAFESFCKILKKNSNPNIIIKILKENIIMTAMFKTNATSISPYYGLKKLFISSVYPYNDVIIKRYMQLQEVSEFELAEIISLLCRDSDFSLAYDRYQKGQETKLFLTFAEDMIAEISLNDVNPQLINKLIQVIKGFINREEYNYQIFPQDCMFSMLNDIYYYIISNELYNETDLIKTLNDYVSARINSELKAKTNPYYINSPYIVFGITQGDLWFDIHKIIQGYQVNWIDNFYLKYNEIDIVSFKPNDMFKPIDDKVDGSDLKFLPDNESLIICSESGSKNFDMYLYDVFTRIAKGIFNQKIKTTLKRTESSTFRKKEYPGLSKTDDIKVKKAIIDFITLQTLSDRDQLHFIDVYKRKIAAVLKNMLSIESTYEHIVEFVDASDINFLLNIFKSKTELEQLYKKAMRYESSDEDALLIKHSEEFLNLKNES